MSNVPKILFFAEAVTLAHVARPAVLAGSLNPRDYDVQFAHCPRYRSLLGDVSFAEHEIESITPELFMAALAEGKPLYDLSTLAGYVEEDLQLLGSIRPDVVVGDMRLSLAVSARLAGIPYITISNACWSPYTSQHYIAPDLPFVRRLGIHFGQAIFSVFRPIAFALHSLPMQKLRKRYGLPGLGWDLREVYTNADQTLYADLPGVYQMREMPPNHHFIGPILWSPSMPFPDWWNDLPEGLPLIYVTLGSSGRSELLLEIIEALGHMDVAALVSTAGAKMDMHTPGNIYLSDYLPGDDAVKRADLVICNGGSPTTYQALSDAKPVIGVAGNLDQHLNMQALAKLGVGIHLRSDQITSRSVRVAVESVLSEKSYSRASEKLATEIDRCDSCRAFQKIIDSVL